MTYTRKRPHLMYIHECNNPWHQLACIIHYGFVMFTKFLSLPCFDWQIWTKIKTCTISRMVYHTSPHSLHKHLWLYRIPFMALHPSIIITIANGIPTTDRIRRTMMVTNMHLEAAEIVGCKHIVGKIWYMRNTTMCIHACVTVLLHNDCAMYPIIGLCVQLLYGGIAALKCAYNLY